MSDGINESKQFMIGQLRESFMVFMNTLLKMPGSPMQKQQAFLRFDEGHMWMQNAVVSYVAPVLQEQVPTVDSLSPVPSLDPSAQAPVTNEEIAAANQLAAQPVEPVPEVQA